MLKFPVRVHYLYGTIQKIQFLEARQTHQDGIRLFCVPECVDSTSRYEFAARALFSAALGSINQIV